MNETTLVRASKPVTSPEPPALPVTHFINGRWSPENGRTFPDYNPYTGAIVAEIAAGGRTEAESAVQAASAAFPAWAAMIPAGRQRFF